MLTKINIDHYETENMKKIWSINNNDDELMPMNTRFSQKHLFPLDPIDPLDKLVHLYDDVTSERATSKETNVDTSSIELDECVKDDLTEESLSLEDRRSEIVLLELNKEETKNTYHSELDVFVSGFSTDDSKDTKQFQKQCNIKRTKHVCRVPKMKRTIIEQSQNMKHTTKFVNTYTNSYSNQNSDYMTHSSCSSWDVYGSNKVESNNALFVPSKNRKVKRISLPKKTDDIYKSNNNISDKIDESKNTNGYKYVRSKAEGDVNKLKNGSFYFKTHHITAEPNKKGVSLNVSRRTRCKKVAKKSSNLDMSGYNTQCTDDTNKLPFRKVDLDENQITDSNCNNEKLIYEFHHTTENYNSDALKEVTNLNEVISTPEIFLKVNQTENQPQTTKKKKSKHIFKMFKNFLKQSKLNEDGRTIVIPLPKIKLEEDHKPIKFDVPITFDLPKNKIILGKLEGSLHFTLSSNNKSNEYYNMEIDIDHNSLRLPVKSACSGCLTVGEL